MTRYTITDFAEATDLDHLAAYAATFSPDRNPRDGRRLRNKFPAAHKRGGRRGPAPKVTLAYLGFLSTADEAHS